MTRDYTFCNTQKCAKRQQCKRWLKHYKELEKDPYLSYLDDMDCMSNDYVLFEKIDKRKEK